MIDNRGLLRDVFARGLVQAEPVPLLDACVPSRRGPWNRVAGMLLGVAIGDGLGKPTEGTNPGDRGRLYGGARLFAK